MSESVRFYSTSVAPEKSVSEVAAMLRKYGAQRFEQVWEPGTGTTVAIRFNLPVPEADFGHMAIRLEPKVGALRVKLRQAHRIDDDEQVERVAWRQLKGILEGILLAVDTGMFSAGEIFLGMAESDTGQTMWQAMVEAKTLPLLESGE